MNAEMQILRGGGSASAPWRAPGTQVETGAIEPWVRQDLARRHDGALLESLPREWLDLIARCG